MSIYGNKYGFGEKSAYVRQTFASDKRFRKSGYPEDRKLAKVLGPGSYNINREI